MAEVDHSDFLANLTALHLEYRLTIMLRLSDECDCPRYLISRREVLIPAVMKQAFKGGEDPVDVFGRYARGLHARHERA